jgi:hypothetical protein
MNTLDRFCDEMHAAAGNPPELERLEWMLRALQVDDSDAAVVDYDDLMRIANRRDVPLGTRVQEMCRRMATGQMP